MYWNSDDRLIQFNFNGQKSGQNRAFHRHRSSPVFLNNILKYRLDCQLVASRPLESWAVIDLLSIYLIYFNFFPNLQLSQG